MFFDEHNPPHIHVEYQDEEAVVSIDTGDIMAGNLPVRQFRFISAWIELHRDELLANWSLCRYGDEPVKIKPLN
jgi:hypothetical protein